jgi:hypothetical protein
MKVEAGKEDGGKKRRSGQGGWRCEEAGKEDGGTKRWARRMEVRGGGVDKEDGGARRRARRMEVQGDGRGGWRYEEEEEALVQGDGI